MPKRFTDTAIWQKPWFRKLTPLEKEAWHYLTAACDNVGVWDGDRKLADFIIGASVDWEALPSKVNGNVEVLPNGKWWLKDFCAFQYGKLRPKYRGHWEYIRLLTKHGLLDRVPRFSGTVPELSGTVPLTKNSDSIISSSSPTPKDKEKDNMALQHAKDFARDYSQKTCKPCTAGFGTMTGFFKALRAAGVNDSDITATRKFFFAWEKRTCFGFDAFRRRFETLLPLATKSMALPRAGPESWICGGCGYEQSNTSGTCLKCGAERGQGRGHDFGDME